MSRNSFCRLLVLIGAFCALSGVCAGFAQAQAPLVQLRGQVVDEDAQPISRVEITGKDAEGKPETFYTDAAGHFEIDFPEARSVLLSFSKPSYFRVDDRQFDLVSGVNDVTVTLNHETELQQSIEVHSASTQIDPETTSRQETLVQREILNTPVPADRDLQQSLVTMPQVLSDSHGTLHVAGARQGQTEILLDGFEMNTPGTGAFNARVNVDAVQSVNVQTGGYGAEYAHAGAGILAIDTTSGDDRYRFGITNFIPGLNFQDGVQLGNWSPRITFSGPLKKGKAWFSEAVTGQRAFRIVTDLPSGQNTEIQWRGDSLTRVQVSLSSKNTLQGAFLFNKGSDSRMGLTTFTPASTTIHAQATRYFVSLKDQIFLGSNVFDIGAAYDTGDEIDTPHGEATYVVTPSNTSGNYFQRTNQRSRRLQILANAASSGLHFLGEHNVSAGWNVSGLSLSQHATRSEIDYLRADNTLLDRATFFGPGSFRLSNTQVGGYLQDRWRPFKPILLFAGIRADWDRLIQRTLVGPRLGLNWLPVSSGAMKFTLAWGVHYQPLNLLNLSQGLDQQRNDQFYDATGIIPFSTQTTTFIVPLNRLVQPRTYNTTAEWDEKISSRTYVGTSFLLRDGRSGFAYQLTSPPGTFTLQNNRNDRYVSGEVWLRHEFNDRAEFKIDYTRSHASSSQVFDPTLGQLIFVTQGPGPVLWDSPHRVVATGWTPLPVWQLFLSGFFEYHTGFPFSVINEQQRLIGTPNSLRFPDYLSLDAGLEKRFRFRKHEWAIRVSCINLTGHNNPDSVVNNVDAQNFLTYGGGHTRSITGRLRLVAQP